MAFWLAAASLAGSYLSSKKKSMSYTPDPRWMSMMGDVMAGVQKGIEEGGYTFSTEIADKLKRTAVEQISTRFAGGAEKIQEGLAPYGNVGALGRNLTGFYTAQATGTGWS